MKRFDASCGCVSSGSTSSRPGTGCSRTPAARHDPPPGERRRDRPLERGVRVPRPRPRAREPDNPRRHDRRPDPARRHASRRRRDGAREPAGRDGRGGGGRLRLDRGSCSGAASRDFRSPRACSTTSGSASASSRRIACGRRWRRSRPPAPSGWADYVRVAARGFFHPTGTCAIGSVVDERCGVLGYEGLLVADASVLAEIPRANPNLTVAAVAERLADMLR